MVSSWWLPTIGTHSPTLSRALSVSLSLDPSSSLLLSRRTVPALSLFEFMASPPSLLSRNTHCWYLFVALSRILLWMCSPFYLFGYVLFGFIKNWYGGQAQVSRMLRLSESEEKAVREFRKICIYGDDDDHKNRSFDGRVFRSPTLFEDMVKCILLCNCQWVYYCLSWSNSVTSAPCVWHNANMEDMKTYSCFLGSYLPMFSY